MKYRATIAAISQFPTKSVRQTGSDSRSLVAKLRELETRQIAIQSEMAHLHPIPRLDPCRGALAIGRMAAASPIVPDASTHRAAESAARAINVHASG